MSRAEHEGEDPWAPGGKAQPLKKAPQRAQDKRADRRACPEKEPGSALFSNVASAQHLMLPEEQYVDNARDAERKFSAQRPKFDWINNSRTAASLATLEIPDVKWIIQRFMPEGVAILASKPKFGKSWLAMGWGISIASPEAIFGGSVNITPMQGDVLYLALEDNDRRLKSRIAKLCLRSPERLTLVSMSDNFPRANEGGIEAIEAWLIAHPKARLVMIDTLAKFRPPGNAKKAAYDQDYDSITPLLKLAHKYSIAILILHHERKMASDDPFDSVSGTLGLTGAVDTLMILQRGPSGSLFYIRGRDVEDEELAVKFNRDTCQWMIIGKADEVDRSKKSKAILAALEDAASNAKTDAEATLSVKEIRIAAGLDSDRGLEVKLHRMAKAGEIERAERGRYRYPHVRNVINDAWMD